MLSAIEGVGLDDEGMKTDELGAKLAALKKQGRTAKYIYILPNFQNPTGVCMSVARRKQAIALAREHGTIIVEDDAYFDLYFTEEASRLMPIAALCPDRVVYLGTFSKVLAPGLRTAYLPVCLSVRVRP